MNLQINSKCSVWLNVTHFMRQRIPDRGSGMGKWPMSRWGHVVIDRYWLPGSRAVAANQVTNKILREKPEEWPSRLAHKLKHRNRANDWFDFEQSLQDTSRSTCISSERCQLQRNEAKHRHMNAGIGMKSSWAADNTVQRGKKVVGT